MNSLQELQGQIDLAQILFSVRVITFGKLPACKRLIRTFLPSVCAINLHVV